MYILEDTDFGHGFHFSDEDVEAARERRFEQVYEAFIQPVLEDYSGREVFQPNEIKDDIRPPYSYTEVKNALEYASDEMEEIDVLEQDMDLFLYAD